MRYTNWRPLPFTFYIRPDGVQSDRTVYYFQSLISKLDSAHINKQTTVNRSFWSRSTGQNEWAVLTTLDETTNLTIPILIRTAPVSFSYACTLAFYQPWTVDGGIWSIRWSAFHACCDSRLVAQLHPVDVIWTARADWCYCACARTLLGEETTAEREHSNSQHVVLCTLASTGSPRLTQDVREMTNYVVRCTNEPIR